MKLFENLSMAALHLDEKNQILAANGRARKLLDLQPDTSPLTDFRFFLAPDCSSTFATFLDELHNNETATLSTHLHINGKASLSITILASLAAQGERIFLLRPQNAYASGCNGKCLYATILEAQYQNNPGGILLVNGKMEMISFNQEFLKIWDIPLHIQQSRDEEASLKSVLDKVSDPENFLSKVRYLYENPDKTRTDEVVLRDGRVLYRHTYPVYGNGIYVGRVWYFLDITPLKATQYQLQKQQILQDAVLEHIKDGIAACDAHGRLVLLNRSSRELHGLPLNQPLPRTMQEMGLYSKNGNSPAPHGKDPLTRALEGENLQNNEITITNLDGEQRTLRVNGQAMHDGGGAKLGAVISLHDITDLNRIKKQLHYMAYHDALTTLPNRRLFHDLLQQCMKQAHRNSQQVAVLFLDLDNFKSVNDRYGHDQGDRLLVSIAKTMQRSLRESDILCRWGGDEFVLGLLDSGGDNDINRIAEKIRQLILDCVAEEKIDCPISVSIGIAIYPTHGLEPDLLTRNADNAMYAAKRHGKNRHEFFQPTKMVPAGK